MGVVNTDYIGTIKCEGKHIIFEKVSIQHKDALLNELKEMCGNPNRTVFDLVSRMNREFSEKNRQEYAYISDRGYCSTYVTPVKYPKAPDFDTYQQEIEENKSRCVKSAEERYIDYKDDSVKFKELVGKCVSDSLQSHNNTIKDKFYRDCKRYANAYCYNALLKELNGNPCVKMVTTDQIGWSVNRYQISEDIEISVYTNFGFGYSSYFYIGLTYKGIDILPYSFMVNYYYADQRDLARYTRLYETVHISWDYALAFVENVANKSLEGDDSFAREFVMNEVQEMLGGLKSILSDPHSYLNKMSSAKNMNNESHYLTVRNMNGDEYKRFKVYPKEISMVFQAEKISGSLDFIEKISALEPIYDKAQEAAKEIKEMATALIPQLLSNIESISKDIEQLQVTEEELDKKIEQEKSEIAPHKEAIDRQFQEKMKTVGATRVSYYEVEENYKKVNPKYSSLKMAYEDLCNRLEKIQDNIRDRKGFKSSLEDCKEAIENKLDN